MAEGGNFIYFCDQSKRLEIYDGKSSSNHYWKLNKLKKSISLE